MKRGERIYSNVTGVTYTISQTLKTGGQAESAYATSDKDRKTFFIKRLLNIKYSKALADRCKSFEVERRRVYHEINARTMPGGACAYIYDFFRERTFYYVVTEKIDRTLEFDVKQLAKVMPMEDKLFLFRIIAYSFFPLEQANIVYADVKPQNILLKYTGERYVAKLIDLESAFFVNEPPGKGNIVGTEPYYSPELVEYNIENNSADTSLLSTKSDIFSLGIILYEFLTGEYPLPKEVGKYVCELIRDRGKVTIPYSWSPYLRSLVKRMLSLNPMERPSVMELLDELKDLPDKSTPSTDITVPTVLLNRESKSVAYVHILSMNKNAGIRYNLGETGWRKYDGPFALKEDDVQLDVHVSLRTANGERTYKGFHCGKISVSETRTNKVSMPIINVVPPVTDYVDRGRVSMTCKNPNAVIHYTLDGTPPDKTSQIYKGEFSVGKNVTIKACAICVGFLPSDIASRNSSSNVRSKTIYK